MPSLRSTRDTALAVALILAGALLFGREATSGGNAKRFAALYDDAPTFTAAINRETSHVSKNTQLAVSGIIVPHHLLAPDLIARGYIAAARRSHPPDRIIVLFPDHFFKARKPFSVTKRGFETVFGPVETDTASAEALLADSDLVETSDLFARDHGLQAHLPFIRHFFPGIRILPIAIAIRSGKPDWDRLVDRLKAHVSERTLIIQSTDYSHFLAPGEAKRHDQETLNLIATGNLAAIARLKQPQHMDSVGAHYIQGRLQSERFKARAHVIANRGSEAYAKAPDGKTTSYIVAAYTGAAAPHRPALYDGQKLFYFAGDTLIGRNLTRGLAKPAVQERLVAAIRAITGGHPLVVNLEGVLLEEVPETVRHLRLAMPADLAAGLLKRLNVKAAGIANNHAHDFGAEPFTEMTRHLDRAGITPLTHGRIRDMGSFRIVALSDLSSSGNPHSERITVDDIRAVRASQAKPPLFALVHWGGDYALQPAQREKQLAEELRRAGVSLIIGTHPHKASPHLQALAGGETLALYSLGNFLFDQTGNDAAGALLEVRRFARGTFATRLIPIPNFYEAIVTAEP